MMDKRLEEQLERVRQLSARVAQIHEQLAQNTELMSRDREHMAGSPLHEVRDFRTWSQHADDSVERGRRPGRAEAADRLRTRRKAR